MRPRIVFTDEEIAKVAELTGLRALEVVGFIAVLNRFTYSDDAIKRAEHHEAMGHNI